jgi:hypothetical protein
MPSEYKTKQYYKLRRQWKECKTEYSDLKFIFDKICIEFSSQLSAYCVRNDLGDPFAKTNKSSQNVRGEEFTTSSSKSFFRKIVTSTHPDKGLKDAEKKEKIYHQATAAKKDGNLQRLYDLGKAVSISPDIDTITLKDLDLLEHNTNEIKDKIFKIKNSYAWIWFSSNNNKRDGVFLSFIESHFDK